MYVINFTHILNKNHVFQRYLLKNGMYFYPNPISVCICVCVHRHTQTQAFSFNPRVILNDYLSNRLKRLLNENKLKKSLALEAKAGSEEITEKKFERA